jgi:L-amino acid N-acyltransferase YncA
VTSVSYRGTIEIRPAVASDAEAIAVIYNQSVASSVATFDTEPRSREAQLKWMTDHDARHPVLVATMDGPVVGWASLSRWSDRSAYDDTAEISIYIAREHQGRGLGRRLIGSILDQARTIGLHTIIARIADGSSASLRLHRSAGFQDIGVMQEVGWKFDRRIDVYLLQLLLTGSRGAPQPHSGVP